MPITLGKLVAGKRRTVAVEFDGEIINITYTTGGLTPAVEGRLAQASRDNRPASGMADELASIIVDWDIVDDKGKPEQVTREILSSLPTQFLVACVIAIGADNRPNATSAEN